MAGPRGMPALERPVFARAVPAPECRSNAENETATVDVNSACQVYHNHLNSALLVDFEINYLRN